MPSALRFCRNCGFRLGTSLGDSALQPGGGVYTGSAPLAAPKKRRRLSGMTWVFVGLLVFFVGAAAFTAIINPIRQHNINIAGIKAMATKSYVGVDGWDTTDKGVTFGSVDAPGGPADKAGLVGGDIITKFDGQDIHDEDQISDLMVRTPIGKTVDVEYLRDGEKKTTKLTTISQDEFRRLQKEFDKRPEGKGQFGYDDDESERVQVPGKNIYGVKLNSLLRSRPADLAGIKEGDIVIEFDGVPIRTTDEFLMRIRRALPYSTVKVVVVRDGQQLEIPVKMGKQ
ncbi:MAG TPA: PDZ domain-containing protein [Pyrinomonadaceae bacterium]|jgi:S1-C subfamily serine protease|nr:PDZ domain-containing protein [Pyrinomonadaceae bacterium]